MCESVLGLMLTVGRTALTFGDMFKIVWGIAITRHVFLNADSSVPVRFQDVHLVMGPALVIPKN